LTAKYGSRASSASVGITSSRLKADSVLKSLRDFRHAWAPATSLHRLTDLIGEQQVREVHNTSGRSQAGKPPRPRIHIEQLVFNFREAIVIHRAEEA